MTISEGLYVASTSKPIIFFLQESLTSIQSENYYSEKLICHDCNYCHSQSKVTNCNKQEK